MSLWFLQVLSSEPSFFPFVCCCSLKTLPLLSPLSLVFQLFLIRFLSLGPWGPFLLGQLVYKGISAGLLTLKGHFQTKVHCGRGQVHLTTFSTIFTYCYTLRYLLHIPSPFSLSWWRLSLSWLYPGVTWVSDLEFCLVTEILTVNRAGIFCSQSPLLSDQVPEAPPFISYLVCCLQGPSGFCFGFK